MSVIIDGVEYAPIISKPTTLKLLEALELRSDSDAGENITIREYFRQLLVTLWDEGEGFSGKRPFGNSCWEYDLYKPLVKAGFIKGTISEYDGVDIEDKPMADQLVFDMIDAALYGVEGDNE